ncbi:MAG: DUF4338 domain-containing protein [Chloroflexi bacterium]|nr:DUF4338 domain-containing protein [Nitrososphaera sp.]MCI0645439.1 DUF4338 domain-containing protein [Chloroflexota bacterium]MCI0731305.1 DUF4338 domain-containing protein [Chloroflexota bacterium]
MSDTTPYLFWPQAIGPYESDLNQLLATLENEATLFLKHVTTCLSELSRYPNAEEARLKYEAYLRVLSDLLRQEWQPELRQGRLYLYPPVWTQVTDDSEAVDRHREAIRKSLSWERRAQFQKQSVREFIDYMERERAFAGNSVSIRSLMADGEVLACQLQAISRLNEEAQKEQIVCAIKPYLQLVTSEARCIYTGLRLQDVWRYFRYKWATPYNPTPGRQMFYLVRDANQTFHPIIGIAALGSSLVQLTVRDDKIGWTPTAFKQRLFSDDFDETQAQTIGRMLLATLNDGLADIATEGLITALEAESPTLNIMQRLRKIEQQNQARRIELLRQKRESEGQTNIPNQLPLGIDGVTNQPLPPPEELAALAMESLYWAKRAKGLYRLLSAKMALGAIEKSIETVEGLRALWQTEKGRKAIRILIQENKKRKVGINMMDLIVCGAIPPYNVLLGGKLVAMLLAGPQVVYDYERKYEGYASTIASKLKGEAVRRMPRLAFLGTTSLYAISSSQYNRIAIPVLNYEDTRVRYVKYGLTKGYGSVHFSEETRNALDKLLLYTQRARLINNRFGEGVNPKLRHVSAGLSAIGLQAVNNFTQHHSQRIVYGVPLGRKTYAFLRGETDDPEYFFEANSSEKVKETMQYIAHYWAKHWFLKRINKAELLEQVASFDKSDYLLSNELLETADDIPVRQQVIEL